MSVGEPIEFPRLDFIAGKADNVSSAAAESVGAEGLDFQESFAVSYGFS